jgi:hypothetical protein
MNEKTDYWGQKMTVQLRESNGSETTLKLSMSTIVAFTVSIVLAVLSGIIIWINAISATVNAHDAKIAVMGQIDTDHRATLEEIKCSLKEMSPVIYEIREDQKRRQRVGK